MKKRKQNLPRPAVHRMELWWAALPTVPGHVQRGTRPVVIVSNDLGNASLVANAAVMLCYDHRTWNQRFKWVVGGAGIVSNIEQVDIKLPKQDDAGELECLGKRYTMIKMKKEDVPSFDR